MEGIVWLCSALIDRHPGDQVIAANFCKFNSYMARQGIFVDGIQQFSPNVCEDQTFTLEIDELIPYLYSGCKKGIRSQHGLKDLYLVDCFISDEKRDSLLRNTIIYP